jgi:hypothetical protein
MHPRPRDESPPACHPSAPSSPAGRSLGQQEASQYPSGASADRAAPSAVEKKKMMRKKKRKKKKTLPPAMLRKEVRMFRRMVKRLKTFDFLGSRKKFFFKFSF